MPFLCTIVRGNLFTYLQFENEGVLLVASNKRAVRGGVFSSLSSLPFISGRAVLLTPAASDIAPKTPSGGALATR